MKGSLSNKKRKSRISPTNKNMNKSMMNVLQKYAEHITHIHDDPEEIKRLQEELASSPSSSMKRKSIKDQLKASLSPNKKSHKYLLVIKIFKAKLRRDTEITGEMDPFVEIEYQGQKFRTSTKWDAGKRPTWNEAFELPYFDPYQEIKINCIDQDPISNDLVGTTSEMLVNDLLFIKGPRWLEL
jgi:C2 domain